LQPARGQWDSRYSFAADSGITMQQVIQVTALTPVEAESCSIREGVLLADESIVCSYKGIRDMLIITSKRLLLVDKQGITGKKQKYLSIPLNKINAFSVETGGTLDLDCDVTIFVSGMGYVHAEIMRPTKNLDPLVETLNNLLF
jgi:hypothetical protein